MKKLFVLAVLVFFLFSCTDYSVYHEVKYTVTGNASKVRISYMGKYGLVDAGACNLPWQFSFYAKPASYLYVSAENMSDTGDIKVELIDEGHIDSKSDMFPCGKVTLSKQL